MATPLQLIREGFPSRPGFDTAVSRALLERADAGGPDTFRLSVPGRIVAFGRRDVVRPGYAAAVAAARSRGFEAVERLAGGQAAAFHEGTLSFSWAIADPEPPRGITDRFESLANAVVEALRGLGVPAAVGPVPGEYCPGSFSVGVAGRRKLMGVGQRLVRRAAHVGGVVVVEGADLVNGVLTPVYERLGYPWDPAATGAVGDEAPATVASVADALVAALAQRHRLEEAVLDDAVLERAARLATEHVPR
jgi:lipoate-protein ligase A